MQSQEEKLSLFIKAINDYAEKQRLRILYEMEEQSGVELSRAEKEALKEAYQLIAQETADVRGAIAADLSSRELSGRRALFEQRRDIADRVFGEAAEKLSAFTSSPDYTVYLEKAAKAARRAFDASPDGTVFRLRPADMKHRAVISAAYGAECGFEEDESIKLGGFVALCDGLGRAVDVTLDTRLEDQREWFGENAKLPLS